METLDPDLNVRDSFVSNGFWLGMLFVSFNTSTSRFLYNAWHSNTLRGICRGDATYPLYRPYLTIGAALLVRFCGLLEAEARRARNP